MKRVIGDLRLVGSFDSRDEMERKAPRECNCTACTPNVIWLFDSKEWIIFSMEQYITFRVVKRFRIAGRGYITVVHNPDRLPIDRNRSAVCKGQFRLPIHGIELTMAPMTVPKPNPDWGLVTSEETVGDYLTIRMYPDEK